MLKKSSSSKSSIRVKAQVNKKKIQILVTDDSQEKLDISLDEQLLFQKQQAIEVKKKTFQKYFNQGNNYEEKIQKFLESKLLLNENKSQVASQQKKSLSQSQFQSASPKPQRLDKTEKKQNRHRQSQERDQTTSRDISKEKSPSYCHKDHCKACMAKSLLQVEAQNTKDLRKQIKPKQSPSKEFTQKLRQKEEQCKYQQQTIKRQEKELVSIKQQVKEILEVILFQYLDVQDSLGKHLHNSNKLYDLLVKQLNQKEGERVRKQANLDKIDLSNFFIGINIKYNTATQQLEDLIKQLDQQFDIQTNRNKQEIVITDQKPENKSNHYFEIQLELQNEQKKNLILQQQIDKLSQKEKELQIEEEQKDHQRISVEKLQQIDEEEVADKQKTPDIRKKDSLKPELANKFKTGKWDFVLNSIKKKSVNQLNQAEFKVLLEKSNQVDKLKRDQINLERNLKSAQYQIEKNDKEVKNLQEIIHEQREYLKHQQTELDNLKKHPNNEIIPDIIEKSTSRIIQDVEQIENVLAQQKQEIESYEVKIVKYKETINNLQQDAQAQIEKLKENDQTIQQLRQQLVQSEEVKQKMELEINKQIEQYTQTINNKEEQIQTLLKQVEECKKGSELTNPQTTITELQNQNSKLIATQTNLSVESDIQLETKLKEKEDQISILNQERDELYNELENLKKSYVALKELQQNQEVQNDN